MRTRACRLVLYLFPRDFRAEFGEDVIEYVRLRRRELPDAGFWPAACLSTSMAMDLIRAALEQRARTLSPADISVRIAAVAIAFGLAVLAVGGAMVAFEHGVRQPLIEATKAGESGASAGRLVVLTGVIAVLVAIYARLPGPHHRRQTSR